MAQVGQVMRSAECGMRSVGVWGYGSEEVMGARSICTFWLLAPDP